MSVPRETAKTDVFKGLKGKLRPWLKAYLDETNPETFMNATGSARAAKYRCKNENSFCQIGYENLRKLESRINEWFEQEGLSDARLNRKMLSLLEARTIQFVKIKGQIKQEDLPPEVMVVAAGKKLEYKNNQETNTVYDDGDTIVAIPLVALETQRRTLDMALKIKGRYQKDNEQKKPELIFAENIPPEKRDALNKAYQQALKDRSDGDDK